MVIGVICLLLNAFQAGTTTAPPLVSKPVIAANSIAVENLTWSWGNATITLVHGLVTQVTTPDDSQSFFFEGEGALLFEVNDPVEEAVLRYNSRKITKLRLETKPQGLQLSTFFKRLQLRGCGSPFGLPAGVAGGDLSSSYHSFREVFDRNRGEVADHLFARHLLNKEPQPLVRAEIDANKDQMVYIFNMGANRNETLIALEKADDRNGPRADYLQPVVLSSHSLGMKRGEHSPAPFLLTHINYDISANDHFLQLKLNETLVPRGRAQRVFLFSLISEVADRYELFPYTVRHVRDESGKELPFHHSNSSLMVTFPKLKPAGQSLKLSFEIEGNILVQQRGLNYWRLDTFPWFPKPELAGRFYTVDGVVRVKKPFVPFASPNTLRRYEDGDYNVLETRLDKPIQFFTVHAGKYLFEETEKDGLTIRVASYALEKSRAFQNLSNLSREIIDYYQQFLGPFPFKEFNIIELNGLGFGQAPPGMMFLTSEAFSPLDRGNRRMSRSSYQRIAHEIAHQYWGHVVKMGDYQERWFVEAFSEYSAALCVRNFQSEARYKNMVRDWRGDARQAHKMASIPTAHRLNSKDPMMNKLMRTYLTYDKGAYMLSQVHAAMGDERFAQFLRIYQDTFAWKFASTNEAFRLMDAMCDADLSTYFDSCFWGTEMPGKIATPSP